MTKLISPAPYGQTDTTLPFGSTKFPYSESDRHRGKDWGWFNASVTRSRQVCAPVSGTITVVADGYVTGKTQGQGWGNHIDITVNSRVKVRLAHFMKGWAKKFKVGQRIDAGDYITQMGNSGDTSGQVHLHEELWIDGVRVDPDLYRGPNGLHLPGTEVVGVPASVSRADFKTKQVALSAVPILASPTGSSKTLITMKKGWDFDTAGRKGDYELTRTVRKGKEYIGYVHAACAVVRDRRVNTPKGLKLRAKPGGKVLTVLPNRTLVHIIGSENGRESGLWREVNVTVGKKAYRGFVSRDFLA